MNTLYTRKIIAVVTAVSLAFLQVAPVTFAATGPEDQSQGTGVSVLEKPVEEVVVEESTEEVKQDTMMTSTLYQDFMGQDGGVSSPDMSSNNTTEQEVVEDLSANDLSINTANQPSEAEAAAFKEYLSSLGVMGDGGFYVDALNVTDLPDGTKLIKVTGSYMMPSEDMSLNGVSGDMSLNGVPPAQAVFPADLAQLQFRVNAGGGLIKDSLEATYANGVVIEGSVIFDAIQTLRPDFRDDASTFYVLTQIPVTGVDADTVHFKFSLDDKTYEAPKADGTQVVPETQYPPAVQAYVDALAKSFGAAGYEVKAAQLVTGQWAVYATDQKQYVVKPTSGIDHLKFIVPENMPGVLYLSLFFNSEEGIKALRGDSAILLDDAMTVLFKNSYERGSVDYVAYNLSQMMSLKVLSFTDKEIQFRVGTSGKDYKCYRDAEGTVQVIPAQVEDYRQQLEAAMPGFDVTVKFNAPTNEYVISAVEVPMDCTGIADCRSTAGRLTFLSVTLDPDGMFKAVKQVIYHETPEVDAPLLLKGMKQLIDLNHRGDVEWMPDPVAYSRALLVLMSQITVTTVGSDKSILFEYDSKRYKITPDGILVPEQNREELLAYIEKFLQASETYLVKMADVLRPMGELPRVMTLAELNELLSSLITTPERSQEIRSLWYAYEFMRLSAQMLATRDWDLLRRELPEVISETGEPVQWLQDYIAATFPGGALEKVWMPMIGDYKNMPDPELEALVASIKAVYGEEPMQVFDPMINRAQEKMPAMMARLGEIKTELEMIQLRQELLQTVRAKYDAAIAQAINEYADKIDGIERHYDDFMVMLHNLWFQGGITEEGFYRAMTDYLNVSNYTEELVSSMFNEARAVYQQVFHEFSQKIGAAATLNELKAIQAELEAGAFPPSGIQAMVIPSSLIFEKILEASGLEYAVRFGPIEQYPNEDGSLSGRMLFDVHYTSQDPLAQGRVELMRVVTDLNEKVLWIDAQYKTDEWVDGQALFEALSTREPVTEESEMNALADMTKLRIVSVENSESVRFVLNGRHYRSYRAADGSMVLEVGEWVIVEALRAVTGNQQYTFDVDADANASNPEGMTLWVSRMIEEAGWPASGCLLWLSAVLDRNGTVSSVGYVQYMGDEWISDRGDVSGPSLFEALSHREPVSAESPNAALVDMVRLRVTSVENPETVLFTLDGKSYRSYRDPKDGLMKVQQALPPLYIPANFMLFPSVARHSDSQGTILRDVFFDANGAIEQIVNYDESRTGELPAKVAILDRESERVSSEIFYSADGIVVSAISYKWNSLMVTSIVETDYSGAQMDASGRGIESGEVRVMTFSVMADGAKGVLVSRLVTIYDAHAPQTSTEQRFALDGVTVLATVETRYFEQTLDEQGNLMDYRAEIRTLRPDGILKSLEQVLFADRHIITSEKRIFAEDGVTVVEIVEAVYSGVILDEQGKLMDAVLVETLFWVNADGSKASVRSVITTTYKDGEIISVERQDGPVQAFVTALQEKVGHAYIVQALPVEGDLFGINVGFRYAENCNPGEECPEISYEPEAGQLVYLKLVMNSDGIIEAIEKEAIFQGDPEGLLGAFLTFARVDAQLLFRAMKELLALQHPGGSEWMPDPKTYLVSLVSLMAEIRLTKVENGGSADPVPSTIYFSHAGKDYKCYWEGDQVILIDLAKEELEALREKVENQTHSQFTVARDRLWHDFTRKLMDIQEREYEFADFLFRLLAEEKITAEGMSDARNDYKHLLDYALNAVYEREVDAEMLYMMRHDELLNRIDGATTLQELQAIQTELQAGAFPPSGIQAMVIPSSLIFEKILEASGLQYTVRFGSIEQYQNEDGSLSGRMLFDVLHTSQDPINEGRVEHMMIVTDLDGKVLWVDALYSVTDWIDGNLLFEALRNRDPESEESEMNALVDMTKLRIVSAENPESIRFVLNARNYRSYRNFDGNMVLEVGEWVIVEALRAAAGEQYDVIVSEMWWGSTSVFIHYRGWETLPPYGQMSDMIIELDENGAVIWMDVFYQGVDFVIGELLYYALASREPVTTESSTQALVDMVGLRVLAAEGPETVRFLLDGRQYRSYRDPSTGQMKIEPLPEYDGLVQYLSGYVAARAGFLAQMPWVLGPIGAVPLSFTIEQLEAQIVDSMLTGEEAQRYRNLHLAFRFLQAGALDAIEGSGQRVMSGDFAALWDFSGLEPLLAAWFTGFLESEGLHDAAILMTQELQAGFESLPLEVLRDLAGSIRGSMGEDLVAFFNGAFDIVSQSSPKIVAFLEGINVLFNDLAGRIPDAVQAFAGSLESLGLTGTITPDAVETGMYDIVVSGSLPAHLANLTLRVSGAGEILSMQSDGMTDPMLLFKGVKSATEVTSDPEALSRLMQAGDVTEGTNEVFFDIEGWEAGSMWTYWRMGAANIQAEMATPAWVGAWQAEFGAKNWGSWQIYTNYYNHGTFYVAMGPSVVLEGGLSLMEFNVTQSGVQPLRFSTPQGLLGSTGEAELLFDGVKLINGSSSDEEALSVLTQIQNVTLNEGGTLSFVSNGSSHTISPGPGASPGSSPGSGTGSDGRGINTVATSTNLNEIGHLGGNGHFSVAVSFELSDGTSYSDWYSMEANSGQNSGSAQFWIGGYGNLGAIPWTLNWDFYYDAGRPEPYEEEHTTETTYTGPEWRDYEICDAFDPTDCQTRRYYATIEDEAGGYPGVIYIYREADGSIGDSLGEDGTWGNLVGEGGVYTWTWSYTSYETVDPCKEDPSAPGCTPNKDPYRGAWVTY